MKKKSLRTGFTTGAAAAAAAKAALIHLLEDRTPKTVGIRLLTDDRIDIPIQECRLEGVKAVCTVIKDAGDDPDVTHKAEIGAMVLLQPAVSGDSPLYTKITGGVGVGKVTKPGLEIPPGEPAINPGPRRMIREAVKEILAPRGFSGTVAVEVFVPQGERLAEKTLNARLGIIGGLSILGTTGLVRPLSHGAYTATIRSAMNVALATGNGHLVLTTGRRSERFAQKRWPELPEEAFIQIGDYFQVSMAHAAGMRVKTVTLAVFFGKAVKMAQGIPHTHAAKSRLTLARVARWTVEITGDTDLGERVLSANTARHSLESLRSYPKIVARVGEKMIRAAHRFADGKVGVRGVIFDYDAGILFDSEKR